MTLKKKYSSLIAFVAIATIAAISINSFQTASADNKSYLNDIVFTGYVFENEETKRIPIPEDSDAKKIIHERAMALFDEKDQLYQEGAPLKAKYQSEGKNAMTSDEMATLERIHADIIDVNLRIDQMNADARALITMSQAEKDALYDAVVIIRESEIPFTGTASDQNAEAIKIYFETMEIGDHYAPIIDALIDVPYYIEVGGGITLSGCASLTSNCDPLLGGVQINTQFNSTLNVTCSYSTATDRTVLWWTEYGFLTAAHCFENNASGNDVKQPTGSDSKIGDLKDWQWDTSNSDCDCAFVEKTGNEMHWKAAWEGVDDSVTFGGWSDPSVNDYVTIVGKNARVTGLQVDALDYSGDADSGDSPPVTHSMIDLMELDNWGAASGSSGGTVHADGTDPDYHGIIQGYITSLGTGSGGKTLASAWSNIDAHFDLND